MARWKRAVRNENRWVLRLDQKLAWVVEQKRAFYAVFGLPLDGFETNELIHRTREQHLIERLRNARTRAEVAVRNASTELRKLVVGLSPIGAEVSSLSVFDRLAEDPVRNYHQITALVVRWIDNRSGPEAIGHDSPEFADSGASIHEERHAVPVPNGFGMTLRNAMKRHADHSIEAAADAMGLHRDTVRKLLAEKGFFYRSTLNRAEQYIAGLKQPRRG
jgi:hypothetical protein